MKFKTVIRLLISSGIGGIIFWGVNFRYYLIHSIKEGIMPLDALFALTIILIIALGVGLLICAPITLLLKRYNLLNKQTILLCSSLISLLVVNTFTGYLAFEFVGNVFMPITIGLLSGLLFLGLNKGRIEQI